MAISEKILGNGQLAATKTALYTVPGTTTCIAKTITLVNTSTTSRDVNLYVCKSGGTSRRIITVDTPLIGYYSLVWDTPLTLGAGDKIEGKAAASACVDYIVCGVERT